MGVEYNMVTTDLVLLISEEGHCQRLENITLDNLIYQKPDKQLLNILFPQNIASQIVRTVKQALHSKSTYTTSYTVTTSADIEYYCVKVVPVNDEKAMVLIENTTEFEENKIKLNKKNALLDGVLNNIVAEITAFDNSGQVILRNEAANKFNDCESISDYIDTDVKYLKYDGKTEFIDEELPLLKAWKGEEVNNEIIIKKGASQSPRTYLVNALPLINENGKRDGVLLAERDVSDLSRVELKLKEKIKDMNMFMYRASHDLKSPIMAMKGVLDFAYSQLHKTEAKKFLELLQKSHLHLLTVVDDLVSLTRVSQKELETSSTSVVSLIQWVTDSVKLMPAAENIRIKTCIKTDIAILTDEALLRIVLQNLLCNAVMHHRPKGEDRYVLVMVFDERENIRIEISDNGLGIPDHIQEKICDVFFRGNPRVPGSGLGLFIVKEAVEKLKGTMELYSKEGAGSTFSITLPKNDIR
jgi:signal transduction histidine kinase